MASVCLVGTQQPLHLCSFLLRAEQERGAQYRTVALCYLLTPLPPGSPLHARTPAFIIVSDVGRVSAVPVFCCGVLAPYAWSKTAGMR
jgi:hypothetical protein